MLNLVTGRGPRVGSSHIMRQAKIRGLDVKGSKYAHGTLPVAGNPGGYYDLLLDEIVMLRSGVAKVWPASFGGIKVPVDRMVVLTRERDAQIASITEQKKREGLTVDSAAVIEYSTSMLDWYLEKYEGEVMEVRTEDIDNQLKDILNFLGE